MDKNNRHERILDCRYYNGEDEAPQGISVSFWGYEQIWVESKYHDNWDYEKEDLKRLGIENFDAEDGTPYSLKCLLFNRYCHWCGLYGGAEAFIKWYREQYQQPRLTNRQRRFRKRETELEKRCRFYKGEKVCPFQEGSKDEHFWKYERIWVERLSQSYTYADKWREELTPYKKIQAYVKEHGLPSSFIGLLVNRDLHWLGRIDEQDFLASIKRDYLKIKE